MDENKKPKRAREVSQEKPNPQTLSIKVAQIRLNVKAGESRKDEQEF